jgi:hypothetical protein
MIIHKSRGKTTGLGVCCWFHCLFKAQEIARPDLRKTDDEISRLAAAEFPGRHFGFLAQPKRFPISEYRHRYNTGKFSPKGEFPLDHTYSFRYDEEGCRVDDRTGTKQLSLQACVDKITQWKQKHV